MSRGQILLPYTSIPEDLRRSRSVRSPQKPRQKPRNKFNRPNKPDRERVLSRRPSKVRRQMHSPVTLPTCSIRPREEHPAGILRRFQQSREPTIKHHKRLNKEVRNNPGISEQDQVQLTRRRGGEPRVSFSFIHPPRVIAHAARRTPSANFGLYSQVMQAQKGTGC